MPELEKQDKKSNNTSQSNMINLFENYYYKGLFQGVLLGSVLTFITLRR
jgi:hypothetical protein